MTMPRKSRPSLRYTVVFDFTAGLSSAGQTMQINFDLSAGTNGRLAAPITRSVIN